VKQESSSNQVEPFHAIPAFSVAVNVEGQYQIELIDPRSNWGIFMQRPYAMKLEYIQQQSPPCPDSSEEMGMAGL
jgi:hypothetical protein